jgi:acyl carrier protein
LPNAEGGIEGTLALIWQEVLGVSRVNAEDNFFDLGGDSLLAFQLRDRVESQFSRSPTVRELLARPTLSAMAQLLREMP